MAHNFSYDVFLSHNSKDKPRVRQIAERLKADGLRVWLDEWNIRTGDIISLKVDEGLEQSRVLLLCISPNALASGWVALERSTAIHRDPANEGRRFVPVLLEDCELPDTLRRYKYLDFREEGDAALADLLTACRPADESHDASSAASHLRTAKSPEHVEPLAVLERKLGPVPVASILREPRRAKEGQVMRTQKTDFLIITPLAEERDAILDRLPNYQQAPPSKEDIRVYYTADLPVISADKRSSKYSAVVMPLSKMGHGEAANATGDAIRRWRPAYVILVGIAGGLAEAGVKLGDVLVGNQIVNYELQKVREKSVDIRWQVHPVDQRLLIASQNFKGTNWRQTTAKRHSKSEPTVHFGTICTGNKVIARAKLAAALNETWKMLVGFEMEAGGVVDTVFQSPFKPGFFMIRGVSDLGDANKDSASVKRWRSYACEIAASYTISFLRTGPVPIAVQKRNVPKRSQPGAPKSRSAPNKGLVETLSELAPAMFESLVFRFDTRNAVPGREAAQSIRAIELLKVVQATGQSRKLQTELSNLRRS